MKNIKSNKIIGLFYQTIKRLTPKGLTPSENAATASIQSTEIPSVVFGQGFYNDNLNWYWMGPRAQMSIKPEALPANISLNLRIHSLEQFKNSPLTIRILSNGNEIKSISFDSTTLDQHVSINLPSSKKPLILNFESDSYFIPSQIGDSQDNRKLTAIILPPTLTKKMSGFANMKIISLITRLKNYLARKLGSNQKIILSKDDIVSTDDYARRIQQEAMRFAGEININDLPPIFHYWSNKYLLPVFETFGFSNPDDFFARHIEKRHETKQHVRVLSIGAGNCDTEVRVGQLLISRGIKDWTITCLDLVPEMLKRGAVDAQASGLIDYFRFVTADFNYWDGGGEKYDVIIANQCLHHVVELERLFDQFPRLLNANGTIITSDMIGRNGHQRWPEAKLIVDQFWKELPIEYRYNRQLNRQEIEFADWDCSLEGFEGIRSQDILPLLTKKFGFELFIGFGNVIDPFTDRSFGWNFNAEANWDREFIDRVHAADDEAIDSGIITPTHMLAIMNLNPDTQPHVWRNRTPERCTRIVTIK